MTITWVTDTCTLSASATHTTAQICTDAGAPTGTGLVKALDDADFYEMREARVVIENGSAWEEKTGLGSDRVVVLFHSYSGNNAAVELQGATSRFDWGNKIGTSITAPVTSKGHHYYFQSYNKSASFHWSRFATTLGNGIFRFYGGMWETIETLAYDTGDDGAGGGTPTIPFSITGASSGATATVGAITVDSGTWGGTDAVGNMSLNRVLGQFTDGETVDVDGDDDSFVMNGTSGSNIIFMPTDEVEIMQANFSRCGGVRFGADSVVLESRFKQAKDEGLSWDGDNTAQFMNKLQLHNFTVGLSLIGDGQAIVRALSQRGSTNDLEVTTFTGNLELQNSTNIANLLGTLDFDGAVSTNYVRESNTFNLKIVDSAGAGVQNIRVLVLRDDTNESYGTDQLTDVNGDIAERISNRFQLDADHLTVATHLDYGNVRIRARDYGRTYHDPIIIPTEAGVSVTRTVVDNPFTIDGTGGQFDDDTAAAFTGVALVEALTNAVSLTYNENTPSADTITRSSGSFLTDNWAVGMFVRVSGTANNDGVFEIGAVVALTITLVDTEDLVGGETIVSRLDGYALNITSGTANTMNKVYSKVQSLLEKTANMKFPHIFETLDSVQHKMPTATVVTGLDNIDMESGFILLQDGAKRLVPVKISNIASGAEMAVVRVSDNVILGSKNSSGTTDTVVTQYSGSDESVFVRVRKAGDVAFVSTETLVGSGLNITAVFPDDPVFTP